MVERKKLSELCSVHTGSQLNRDHMLDYGAYPVINGGKVASGYTDSFNEDGENITISQGGESAGFVNWIETKFWAGAHCYVVVPFDIVSKRFLYHLLKNHEYHLQSSKQGAGIPGLNRKTLLNQELAIPSLPEQDRIVGVLDTFTASIENIKQQIEQRKKQYEYYRDQLLNPEGKPETDVVPFGETCQMIKGNGVQKADFVENGIGCIHYGQIYTHYGPFTYTTNRFVSKEVFDKARKASKGDIIMTDTSENVEDICKSVAYLGDDDIAVSNHALIIKHKQNPKFISYSTFTKYFFNQKRKYAFGVKVTGIRPEHLGRIMIYLPDLTEQNRIVAILDKFEDSSSNLEQQLEQRQKQYEYYRNKLLTFE